MTTYIVDIEAVDTRYTKQWKEHLPKQLRRATNEEVVVISGGETPQATTPGAFLNFGGTNVYKSKQLEQIGKYFCDGLIKNGDYFIYTDAWNPTVIQLRYMAELLGVDIRVGGMWHAGSYDPQDFLGRLIGDKPWVRKAEASMYECYDDNFFATEFHRDMFEDVFMDEGLDFFPKTKIVGWPMEYLATSLEQYKGMPKKDLILFPHRIAPEKQVDIFRNLKDALPQYEFVVCQDLVGSLPMVPDRLSYKEMAIEEFKYPSEWTESYNAYRNNKDKVIEKITDYMENYENYLPKLVKQVDKLKKQYFSGTNLYKEIKNGR